MSPREIGIKLGDIVTTPLYHQNSVKTIWEQQDVPAPGIDLHSLISQLAFPKKKQKYKNNRTCCHITSTAKNQ